MRLNMLFSGLTLAVALGLTAKAQAQLCPLTPIPGSATSHLTELKSENDYQNLIGVMAGIDYAKFSIELASGNTYFQNTTMFPFHYQFFVKHIPGYENLTADEYERYLFSPTEMKLTAGAIYYSKCFKIPNATEPGMAGFTIYFRDKFPLDQVVATYETLKKRIPFMSTKLAFMFERPQDFFQQKRFLDQKGIPSVNLQSFIKAGPKTIVYHAATSFGFLRKLDQTAFEKGEYTAKDILILDQVPLDVGPVSGIITTAPQSPHSHIILRAMNQNVPDAYIPGADQAEAIKNRIGQLVRLEVKPDGNYVVETADAAQADAYFKSRVPTLPEPVRDLTVKTLFPLTKPATRDLVKAYGAKGTNFAVLDQALRKAGRDRSYFDGSFLVPFSFYEAHVGQKISDKLCKKALKESSDQGSPIIAGANKRCETLIGQPISVYLKQITTATALDQMLKDAPFRKGTLEYVKAMIEEAGVDDDFEALVKGTIGKLQPADRRMRFRSSTNSEDLPGLNGAGLYKSKGGCLGDEDREKDSGSVCQTPLERSRIEAMLQKLKADGTEKNKALIADLEKKLKKTKKINKAIRGVYASLWGEKAFLFRDYYRIPHDKISMGILVHPSFVNESANGVAIVKMKDGVLSADVVVQKDDVSITNPELPGAVPERFQATLPEGGRMSAPTYVSRSNLSNGQPVLSEAQAQDLLEQMAIVYKEMKRTDGSKEKTYDLEFIVSEKGTVLIKQARPLAGARSEEGED